LWCVFVAVVVGAVGSTAGPAGVCEVTGTVPGGGAGLGAGVVAGGGVCCALRASGIANAAASARERILRVFIRFSLADLWSRCLDVHPCDALAHLG
jgi:hypothetical protein